MFRSQWHQMAQEYDQLAAVNPEGARELVRAAISEAGPIPDGIGVMLVLLFPPSPFREAVLELVKERRA